MGYHQFPQSEDHQDVFRAGVKAGFKAVFKADQTLTQTDAIHAHNKMLRPPLLLAGELEHSQNITSAHRTLLD